MFGRVSIPNEPIPPRPWVVRASDARFHNVVTISTDGIVIVDGSGMILFVNPAAHALFGRKSEELLGEPFGFPIVAGETTELDIANRKGKRTIAEMRVVAAEWEGKPAYVTTLRDVTERKRMEAELAKARNLESLGILAGGIAHDFNNLFQVIIGNLELAKINTEKSSEALPFLEKAEEASGLARKLTSQLIAFSPGGNSLPIIIQPASHIKEEAVSTLGGSGLVAEFELADTLWPIKVDPSQFRNVIKQMVLNAMEAMPAESGGHLKIMAANESLPEKHGKHSTLAPGNYVRISIQDQGCGISNDDLPRIFDPYFSTKERGSLKGMGLGLALCDAIIRKHGGAITVQSNLGKTTTFHVYIPAVGSGGIKGRALEQQAC